MQVVEQFSDLSFIPCSFVAKDSSRKKRRSFKRPTLPSHDPVSTSFKTHDKNCSTPPIRHVEVIFFLCVNTKHDRITLAYTQAAKMESTRCLSGSRNLKLCKIFARIFELFF